MRLWPEFAAPRSIQFPQCKPEYKPANQLEIKPANQLANYPNH
jgi:hypothetical protein